MKIYRTLTGRNEIVISPFNYSGQKVLETRPENLTSLQIHMLRNNPQLNDRYARKYRITPFGA